MRSLFCALSLVALLAPSSAARAQDPAAFGEPVHLALQGAAHRQIRLGAERPAVEFPLDLTRPVPGLAVAVLEASHGNPPAAADGVFTLTLTERPDGVRLRAEADPDALRTGNYTLRLRLTAPGALAYEPTIQIAVPAPELRLPAALSVQRIRPLLTDLFGPGETSAEPLVIREVGRLAGLSGIRLTQIGPLTHEGRGTVGRVEVAAAPIISPGGIATLDYRVEPAQLPAGEVRGLLQLTARELAAPIDIPLTITTRVDPIWIVALVFLGVLLGYLSRGLLGRWRARTEALVVAAAERRALAAALELAADREHRAAIEQIRGELDDKIRGTDAQAIADAAAAARVARLEARDALKARHEALAARLDELVAALAGRPLPGAIEQRVDARLDAIRAALVARETDRAEGLIDELGTGRDLDALRNAWTDWQLDAQRRLRNLAAIGDLAQFDPAPVVAAVQGISTVADFAPLFQQGAAAYAAVHRFAGDVWMTIDGAIEEILAQLGPSVDPALAAAIREVHQRARQALTHGQPIEALGLLAGELATAVATAIAAARPGDAARTLAAGHKYREAAAIGAAPTRRMPNFTFDRGGEIPESDYDGADFAPGRARAPAAPPPGPAVWRRDVAVARLAFDAPPPAPAIDPPDPWLPQLLGSLVNAVVIALVAYVLYAEDFVGDGRQLVSTLLWAYGLDLGAEAVKAQLKQVNPTVTR
ncbi:MAG: hypothetical protein R3F65_20995 [bacterium]